MYTVEFRALVKYDHEDGSRTRYDYPDGWLASESPFARRLGATSEDDGYVVTIMTNAGTYASECWVFSAREIADGPIARVKLPARVPSGFHAKWLPGDRIWGGARAPA
jgi:carotenoid cleavage dioxygenase